MPGNTLQEPLVECVPNAFWVNAYWKQMNIPTNLRATQCRRLVHRRIRILLIFNPRLIACCTSAGRNRYCCLIFAQFGFDLWFVSALPTSLNITPANVDRLKANKRTAFRATFVYSYRNTVAERVSGSVSTLAYGCRVMLLARVCILISIFLSLFTFVNRTTYLVRHV